MRTLLIALIVCFATSALADWSEPTKPIAPGWKCHIEHRSQSAYPDELLCMPPAFTRFHNRRLPTWARG